MNLARDCPSLSLSSRSIAYPSGHPQVLLDPLLYERPPLSQSSLFLRLLLLYLAAHEKRAAVELQGVRCKLCAHSVG